MRQIIKEESSGQGEKPGYLRAVIDPQYRRATIICLILSVANQATGINAINIYATQIYQKIQD